MFYVPVVLYIVNTAAEASCEKMTWKRSSDSLSLANKKCFKKCVTHQSQCFYFMTPYKQRVLRAFGLYRLYSLPCQDVGCHGWVVFLASLYGEQNISRADRLGLHGSLGLHWSLIVSFALFPPFRRAKKEAFQNLERAIHLMSGSSTLSIRNK